MGQAFRLLGTEHHRRLDKVAQKLNMLSEEKLDGEITGILDLLTVDELIATESYHLWDYKTAGSFKVAKALGLVAKKIPDPNGSVYKTSGKWGNAGDPKMVTIWELDPEAVDMWDWILQFNTYRRKIEPLGFPISRITAQVTVRDGGTMVAESRGITENIYLIPIPFISDEIVDYNMNTKREALLHCLKHHEMPPKCDLVESWNGRRCQGFCDVTEFCI
jgi:hypothetical protein